MLNFCKLNAHQINLRLFDEQFVMYRSGLWSVCIITGAPNKYVSNFLSAKIIAYASFSIFDQLC